MSKAFAHHPELSWLAASLACAIALVLMQMTRTTHPPAGATALLAVTEPAIVAMSWYYIAIVLLSALLVLAVALLNNNMQVSLELSSTALAGLISHTTATLPGVLVETGRNNTSTSRGSSRRTRQRHNTGRRHGKDKGRYHSRVASVMPRRCSVSTVSWSGY